MQPGGYLELLDRLGAFINFVLLITKFPLNQEHFMGGRDCYLICFLQLVKLTHICQNFIHGLYQEVYDLYNVHADL